MVTYEKLTRHTNAAPSLIGMSLSAFNQLYAEFEVVHLQRMSAARVTRRKRQWRQRYHALGLDGLLKQTRLLRYLCGD
jgi:hypothetical protein